MKKVQGISRRELLVGSATGAGLIVGYSVLPNSLGSASKAIAAGNWDHQQFLSMEPNGVATIHITKTELGQHVGTALAQAVAEELEIDWNDVRVDYPDSDEKWGLMITGGSWSVNWTFDRNSRIGASARIALVEAGAKLMGVGSGDCHARNSKVIHTSGASKTYAEILSQSTIDRTFSEEEMKAITLKKFGEYSLVGKSVPALDIPAKVNGTARYGVDIFVPNMVYGRLVPWPTRFGAVPKKVDDSAAKAIDGYVGVFVQREDNTGVNSSYVVAMGETYWAAEKAAKAINVTWDKGPNQKVDTGAIRKFAVNAQKDPASGFTWVLEGDVDAAMKDAATTHKATYETSIAYHGLMEPMNCVAMEKDGIWHLFTANQWQLRMTGMTATALGVEPATVVHHQQYAGCGFGRRLEPDAAIPAALASRQVGRPVKLIYTREDDMMFDFHRSLTYQVVEGGVNAGGQMDAMKHDVCSGWATERMAPGFLAESVDKKGKIDQFSTNGSDHWYNIPNHYVRSISNDLADQATPAGQLRSVAPAWTFWAVESYIDEVARKVGQDPLAFRLAHLDASGKNAGTPPNTVGGANRLRNALLVAAGRAGYGVKPLGENVGMGIASVSSQERGSPTWTACVAEVHVDPSTGVATPLKVTIAMDIGTAVNPDGALAQIEGSTLYGLSIALYDEITMKNGSIEQSNFDTWTPMRLNQAPDVDVAIIQNGHYPAGTGEPAVTVIAPAIANAIHSAVGARVRSLPITPEKVKSAMREA